MDTERRKKQSVHPAMQAHIEQLYMFVDAIDELGALDKCISIHEMRRVLKYIRESLAGPNLKQESLKQKKDSNTGTSYHQYIPNAWRYD